MNTQNSTVTYNSRNINSTKAFAQYLANNKGAGVNIYSHTWSYDGETFTDYVTGESRKEGNEYKFVCYIRPQVVIDEHQGLQATYDDMRMQW